MRVIQQSSEIMELKSERSRRDLIFLSLVGIGTPIIGVLILLSRQDIIAVLVGSVFLFGLSFLFTGVPDSVLFDKTNDSLTDTRKKPIGHTSYKYRLSDITAIEINQNANYYFVAIMLRSGKIVQSSRLTDKAKVNSTAESIQQFLFQA